MRSGSRRSRNSISRCLATANTIPNAPATIGVTGQCQSWNLTRQLLDRIYLLQVTDLVLRHRVFPFRDFDEQRFFSDPQQFTKITLDSHAHLALIERKDLRLQRSTRERAQQYVPFRRASRKFHAAERTRDQRSLFDERHDKTESVQRMRNCCAPVTEVDRRRGRVFD